MADWLHNLAQFSCWDFQEFDEQRFWQEYEMFSRKYPHFSMSNYKPMFEDRLEERRKEGQSDE